MDVVVKQSIEGRYMAFSGSYELTDTYKKKVEELFKKINELGETCSDAMDFESKFQASPLNKEYTDLFTEIATNCKCIIPEPVENNVKSDKERLKEEVVSDVKYVIKDATLPARRIAREKFDSKMRDTPLGKIEQASNTLNVFKRIFKK